MAKLNKTERKIKKQLNDEKKDKYVNEETKIVNTINKRFTVPAKTYGLSPEIVKDIAEEFGKSETVIKGICFRNDIKLVNDDKEEVKSIDGISKAIAERSIFN